MRKRTDAEGVPRRKANETMEPTNPPRTLSAASPKCPTREHACFPTDRQSAKPTAFAAS